MSISTTDKPRWTERFSQQGQQPSQSDLRVSSAAKVQAKMVAVSSGILNACRYMRDHPVDFAASTAVSAASFYAVKTLLFMTFPALGFGLAAAMVTAGALGVGRTLFHEIKQQRYRVEALYETIDNPTPADLAEARNINISGVIESGIKRAMFTGIFAGLTGALIGNLAIETKEIIENYNVPLPSSEIPTEAEYEKFITALGDRENSGQFKNISNPNPQGFKGRLQFGEAALDDSGFYIRKDSLGNIFDPNVKIGVDTNGVDIIGQKNDWTGQWTQKAQDLGVNSIDDFLNTPEAQKVAEKDWIAKIWSYVDHYDFDEHLGETAIDQNGKEFTVTKTGLITGYQLGGERGLRLFFEEGDAHRDLSDGHTHISDYMRDFADYKAPFEANNPSQLPYYIAHLARECSEVVSHIWPVDVNAPQRISDLYNARGGTHDGLDIATYKQHPDIMATADGVIEKIEAKRTGYGNNIIIRHIDNTSSLYGHLNQFTDGLEVGHDVKQGDIIGQVGSTGRSSGPHLHYELRNAQGQHFNPLPCLPVPEIINSGRGR